MLTTARRGRWHAVALAISGLALVGAAEPAAAQQAQMVPGCDGTLRPYCNAPDLAAHHAEGAKAEVVDEYLLGGPEDTGGPLPGDGYGYSTY